MKEKPLRVAMIAPPWLPIPPHGYGGVEAVLYALIPSLQKLGVHVQLFTVEETSLKKVKKHFVYGEGQYRYIHRPYYDTMPIYAAHMLHALDIIRRDGRFDIIHDHNATIGPLLLSQPIVGLPPAVHTIHNPPFTTAAHIEAGVPDNRPMWLELAETAQRLHLINISRAMQTMAPDYLHHLLLPPVHNAVMVDKFPYVEKKKNYFITLARFHPEKGQHIAVRICNELGYKLRMAGSVGGITARYKLMLELANPLSIYRGDEGFRYFSDKIFPLLPGNRSITYMGEVAGRQKLSFLSQAKALLFPVQWEEPFGMAAVEALACGTPVVAMARGALPEIIEHGVNGFLANTEAEFKECMQHVDEIEPSACRKSVERNFSADLMARRYLDNYHMAIAASQAR
jgi:glycosyltransferase involved in cell wall biosynthesis